MRVGKGEGIGVGGWVEEYECRGVGVSGGESEGRRSE